MDTAVEADLRQFRMAVGIYHKLDNAIQQDDVVEELVERLREELDYKREAANMRLYRSMLETCPDVIIPEPLDHLSTQRLLIMEWVEGSTFNTELCDNLTEAQKKTCCRSFVSELVYSPLSLWCYSW